MQATESLAMVQLLEEIARKRGEARRKERSCADANHDVGVAYHGGKSDALADLQKEIERRIAADNDKPLPVVGTSDLLALLAGWRSEAKLLRDNEHPRRQRCSRADRLREEVTLLGCAADVERLVGGIASEANDPRSATAEAGAARAGERKGGGR